MPDGLYERDILAWSQHQAELLRRLGRGERVNDLDWTNLAEEIETVGRSELRAVESFLMQMIVHLLKLWRWPESDAANHWRGEIVGFQDGANQSFTPSMEQKIDIGAVYARAIKRLKAEAPNMQFPADVMFTVKQLLTDDWNSLLACVPMA